MVIEWSTGPGDQEDTCKEVIEVEVMKEVGVGDKESVKSRSMLSSGESGFGSLTDSHSVPDSGGNPFEGDDIGNILAKYRIININTVLQLVSKDPRLLWEKYKVAVKVLEETGKGSSVASVDSVNPQGFTRSESIDMPERVQSLKEIYTDRERILLLSCSGFFATDVYNRVCFGEDEETTDDSIIDLKTDFYEFKGGAISCECANIDSLLAGGFHCGEMTELFGSSGSGKTEICMKTTLNCISLYEKNVLYFDTANSFQVVRLIDMHRARGDVEGDEEFDFLERVHCIPVFDIYSLISELEKVKAKLKQATDGCHGHECGSKEDNQGEMEFFSSLRLIVVDSVYSLISPLLSAKAMGHCLMTHASSLLRYIAREFDIAVVVTNCCTFDRESIGGNGSKSALGKTWTYAPSVSVFLQRDVSNPHMQSEEESLPSEIPVNVYKAELRKSSHCPLNSTHVYFTIGEGGVANR
eukprot:Nk52_evm39s292 gene=Nk52_evmTU39s292